MAAIVDADVSIDSSGNIRWTGAATTNRHTVLEFIQYLMDKQDDAQAAGNDLLDITVDTPFDRSTNQIVTLNSPFNIDDTFALHLYDGSVSQTEPTIGGETLYSGLRVIGPVETGTEYMILQNGNVLSSFWGTGINAEAAPSLVFSRHLIRSKFGGSKVDGQRITVLARELGDQYRRFPATLGTGNSVAAIGNGADIFNEKTDATLAGFTDIVNIEGFQELDIDGTGAAGQEFYSQWDKGARVTNDVYERTKWISQRSHIAEDSGTQTGTDYIIDNATILGQSQEFIATAASEKLTEARLFVKEGGGTPTGTVYCFLYLSNDAATAIPTGAALARSEPILATHFTTTYEETIFRFNRFNPVTGADQLLGLDLTANQQYFIAIHNDEGTAADFFHVRGDVTGTFANRNKAQLDGVWVGQSAEDLDLHAKSSPSIHTVAGEILQGINIEVGFDAEAGVGLAENDIIMWGTKVTYDTLAGGPFFPGEQVTFKTGSTLKSGGEILFDDAVDEIVVALDSPAASVLTNNDTIEGLTSGATAAINVTIVDDDKSGGTGVLLAKDDNGVTGEVYLNVLTGVNPVDNNVLRKDDRTGNPLVDLANATVTLNTRTINPEYVGTSTGSNIIGAYGIGYDPLDVGASDRFTSLDNTSRVPPNNVVFTVSGLVSGEDRVLVGPRTGTALDRGQWLLATALASATETAVVVKTGTDTVPFVSGEINWPASGNGTDNSRLRVQLDNGIYKRQGYTSHDSVDTFTIPSTAYNVDGAAINNNVFLAFIDVLCDAATETFTGVHTGGSDRDLFVRVRDGGATPIKTFESTAAQFLSTPQTVAAIRTSDA